MATVTGFFGAKPGNGPYFSPRFRPTKKSNAGKFYRKRTAAELIDEDDYLAHFENESSTVDFEIEDILSPRYSEFGFVRAYKARLRRKGLNPKKLYCVNRHTPIENPRTCLTSLPKLRRGFLVEQIPNKTKHVASEGAPEDPDLIPYTVKGYRTEIVDDPEKPDPKSESKLDTRLRELEIDSEVDGYIVRRKRHGRPLGNITSSTYLIKLLENVEGDIDRRPSIFYRTELT